MAKSQSAFRTISEVSTTLDTPTHVLRFWESKFSQIKPVKRAGGRRYYRPEDIDLLAGIKTLLHDQGMTIKGAQKLLRENGVKHVIAIGASSIPPEAEKPDVEQAQPDPAPVEPLAAENVVPMPAAAPTPPPAAAAVTNASPKSIRPSTIATLNATPSDVVRGNAAQIAPLLAQLSAIRDRIKQSA